MEVPDSYQFWSLLRATSDLGLVQGTVSGAMKCTEVYFSELKCIEVYFSALKCTELKC